MSSSALDRAIASHSAALWEQVQEQLAPDPPSEAIYDAYRAMPRHRFVPRYRHWHNPRWFDVTEENLIEHLGALYGNHPLGILGEPSDDAVATISQPLMVVIMLRALDLKAGQRVLELGTGSGWNAALMGHLVGGEGHITTVEIVPELCERARRCLDAQGVSNVSIVEGDGADGHVSRAPYDRVIMTVGFSDLSPELGKQLVEGGLLLAVVKNPGGMDWMLVLRKRGEVLDAEEILPCAFVQATGRLHVEALEPAELETMPEWQRLANDLVERRPFFWGSKGERFFEARTMWMRWFLDVTEPGYQAFREARRGSEGPDPPRFFGLWGEGRHSLVVARPDSLDAYGSTEPLETLMRALHRWVDLGLPSAANFGLSIYPSHASVEAKSNEWLVRRKVAQYLWKAPFASAPCPRE